MSTTSAPERRGRRWLAGTLIGATWLAGTARGLQWTGRAERGELSCSLPPRPAGTTRS